MKQWIGFGLVVVALSLAYLAALSAKDPTTPARDAARRRFPDAEVLGVEQNGDGQAAYDVSLRNKTGAIEAVFSGDGAFIHSEEKLAWSAVPPEVRKTLETLYPQATRRDVTRNTRADSLGEHVSFVVEVNDGGRTHELLLDAHGKVLADHHA
jgi:hypothetical protein